MHILNSDSPILVNYLGELTTERVEKELPEGLLVIDKSSYFDVTDYELEFECSDRKEGEIFFQSLLTSHDIPVRHTPNKILRFYNEKMRRNK